MSTDIGDTKYYDVCIIGAGVCGLFQASQFLQSKMSVILIESGKVVGGQINLYQQKIVYNMPLIDSIKSEEIVKHIKTRIEKLGGCDIEMHSFVADIKSTDDDGFYITIKSGDMQKQISCKYVILATGKGSIKPNKLPMESAKIIEGKQLFYCIENKESFADKDVIIAGGGDSVIDWSCELEKIAKSITVIHRREIDKPENPEFLYFKDLCKAEKIKLKVPYNITDLIIENGVFKGVKAENKDGSEEFYGDRMIVFYGLKTVQNGVELYRNIGLDFDVNGFKVNYSTNETNCKNIFAIGDCCWYDGKVKNIFMGFSDATRCFYEICHRESGVVDIYGHKK